MIAHAKRTTHEQAEINPQAEIDEIYRQILSGDISIEDAVERLEDAKRAQRSWAERVLKAISG